MNKKKIIPTTLMFLAIVVVVVLFKSVFGAENTLVGVAGITAALSLLGTDYTLNPIKNTIYFVVLEVILGIASFLASTNALLGLIITFCVIFYILYAFTYNIKKPTYVAFTLGYFFMLYTPITLEELPLRLGGLAFCGLAIMILQLLLNRNRLKKQTNAQINVALKCINEQISLIVSDDDYKNISKLNSTANSNLKGLIETFYETIDNNIKLSKFMFQYLFIAQFLYSLNITLNKANKSNRLSTITNLNELLNLLTQINNFVYSKDDVLILLSNLDTLLNSNSFSKPNNYLEIELNSHVSILRRDLDNTQYNTVSELSSQYFTMNLIKELDSFKNNMSKDSLKFTFAFRGALVTSLGVFIVSVFNIDYGKWLVFSLTAIVQPYLDSSKTKSHERIMGTVIGFVIFEIVFSLITDTTSRTLIILLVGYLSNYQTNYRDQMTCTTISSLGAASIGANITILGFERLLFVFIGTVIALYANKLIFPYKISETTKSDIKYSIKLNEKIFSMLYDKCLINAPSTEELKSIININKLLNKKIDYNNNMLLSNDVNNYIYSQHILMDEIRIILNLFNENRLSQSSRLKLVYDIDYLTNKDLSTEDIIIYINKIDDTLSQLILVNILDIKENLIQSKNISKLVSSSI